MPSCTRDSYQEAVAILNSLAQVSKHSDTHTSLYIVCVSATNTIRILVQRAAMKSEGALTNRLCCLPVPLYNFDSPAGPFTV